MCMSEGDETPFSKEFSAEVWRVINQLQFAARTRFNIILLGQTGAVAEFLAREIHDQSGRKGQFIAVNCESLSDTAAPPDGGKEVLGDLIKLGTDFENTVTMADGGTLFLDHAEKMSLMFQGRLAEMLDLKDRKTYRWGEERDPLKLRVVAAMMEDPLSLLAKGCYYEKLCYLVDELRLELHSMNSILKERIVPYYQEQARKGGH